MVEMVKETLDVRFNHVVILSKLQLDGEFVHRIKSTDIRSIPITATQKVLLIDRFQDAFDGQLQQLVLSGRDA